MTEHQPAESDRATPAAHTRHQSWTGAIGIVIGLAAGLLSLTPWLLTGGTLPLQNLWATGTLPDDMPFSLLPISQYMLRDLVGIMATSGTTAALALRWWRPARRRAGLGSVAVGLVAAHLTAVVQSFLELRAGLAPGPGGHPYATYYFYGMLAGVLLAVAMSFAILASLSSRSPNRAAFGAALTATPTTWWLSIWFNLGTPGMLAPELPVLQWLPAAVVGAALAALGLRTLRNGAVWLASLTILWITGPVAWAVQFVVGSRAIVGRPDQVEAGLSTLSSGLAMQTPVVATALAIGIAGSVLYRRLRRSER
ncbi:hypothetical protein [Zhihengliuella halotolerans]|uniref:Uncharacterized protein n=1 Tax=Zhihengliuella halotolerans TaxID=370736 RepID=A0A4Q8AG71_9MICC|nr:hypothetical protein [Zhihengliuella halotolerans]RZU63288.1 hypothetical protein EV380_2900 [Zhihengliuella halotolerans]